MKRAAQVAILSLAASAAFAEPAGLASAAPATAPFRSAVVVIADPAASIGQRERAARELLRNFTPDSIEKLQRRLEDAADPQGQLAVARAITGAGVHPAELMVPLRLLMGTDRALTEAAAQALAAYANPEALRLLINFAAARQQRESDRLMAIRAVGTIGEKAAAEFLVALVLREDDTLRIRNAAADALVEMTGQFQNGHDPRLWQNWWNANSAKPDIQWRNEVRDLHASRYVQMRTQYQQLTSELQNILTGVYENTTPAQQSPLLLTYLRSNHPEIRRVGAGIIHVEAMAARPISPEAREQLRQMIGDVSSDVRLAVAGALLATNDPGAIDALLAQLQRETDPQVRAALAAPIASIGDLRAVPALRKLLSDPSLDTAVAGATALRELGPVIRERDPALAREVARDLQQALATMPPGAGTLPLREAIAEAFVPLRDSASLPTLYRLLSEPGSARIRWAALRALGELRDPKPADTIARYLEDRESGVRLEAVKALGKTSATEFAEELFRRMNPVEETDASVREEAWNVLRGTFAKMSLEQLSGWVPRFANDPAKRAAVLQVLILRNAAAGREAVVASAQQSLGVALAQLDQPADAAAAFAQALKFFSAQPGQEMMVEQLTEQYLQALLRSRTYREAADFSATLLAQRSAYQQTVGVLFRNHARRLAEEQNWPELRNLAAAARNIKPPLADRYLEEISALEKQAPRPAATTAPNGNS